jgi:transcriptional antiterminator NusG
VIDGPFEDFVGEVTLVEADRRKVTIEVNLFGRQTTVQLDFEQVVSA